MYNPIVLKELLDEAVENNDRVKAFEYATLLDKIDGSFTYRYELLNEIQVNYANIENMFIVNIKTNTGQDYKPILMTDRKNRVIKYITEMYTYCTDIVFRIDSREGITFINHPEDLEYFEWRMSLRKILNR